MPRPLYDARVGDLDPLGDTLLYAICIKCRRGARLDGRALARRFRSYEPIKNLEPKLRCRRCGAGGYISTTPPSHD